MAIRNDGAEPALQGRSLRAARTQCSSSEPTILQPLRSVRERLLQCGISTALMSESGQKHALPRRTIAVRFTRMSRPRPDGLNATLCAKSGCEQSQQTA